MKFSTQEQAMIRQDIFRWLDEKQIAGQYEFSRAELENYSWFGQRIPLVSKMKGIWNPASFDETLSILTSIKNPYNDNHDDVFVDYAYQARDGGDNDKLKLAQANETPLIYFRAMRPGYYTAHYPVYVVDDNPVERVFRVALDSEFRMFADPLGIPEDQREYFERLARSRAHQPEFRWQVMRAYAETCAVCNLKHVSLLDAAHIIPDSHELGLPIVTNGLSLCKIHHAAYDKNLLGISPDYQVAINSQLLHEVDGPMLKHGIQEMHRRALTLPSRAADQPNRDNLDYRYQEFVAA